MYTQSHQKFNFIADRRPFGVEQEFFIQLFVEHDPNLRLPTVGELLKRMFTEQQITFTKVVTVALCIGESMQMNRVYLWVVTGSLQTPHPNTSLWTRV